MARCLVKERCLVDGLIRRPGDVVDYSGEPRWYLEPINPPAAAEEPAVEPEPEVAAEEPVVADVPQKRKPGRPRKNA